ncbi:MAG: 2-phospho-L-lactate transferase [Acidimicrobiaceae bacterium]
MRGLVDVVPPAEVTAVVNVADDLVLHGLHISPDLDTVMYTLAGAINTETGWGLEGETWQAMATLERYGGRSWFRLGDRDLGTHLYRTQRLAEGAPLSTVTSELALAWSLELRLLPVSDQTVRTMVTVEGEGEIGFQDYFVGRQHSVAVTSVRFDGAENAQPAPGVLEAIGGAAVLVIAPSNPIVSIGPVLAIDEVRDAVIGRRTRNVAVSPIVAGAALKGPADRMLRELGHEPSVVGVAKLYAELASVLVIDEADAALAGAVEAAGMECLVVPTVMSSPKVAASLARATLEAVG